MPPQCCRCNGKGRCKDCVCARSGTNCTPSHIGRCENHGKVARTNTRDEDLVDSAGRPDVVSDQLERSNSQQTLTLITGQEIYVENMENALLLDNQISNMEPVLPSRDNQTPTYLTSSHQQPAGDNGNYTDPWPLPTCSQLDFQWGQLDGQTFCEMIDTAYSDRKRNIFLPPSGAAGKSFIQEITRLLQAFANDSQMESIALKASFVMQILLLQKPSKKSKSKDHISHLKRRLEQGDIPLLIQEGRCIQRYLHNRPRPSDDNAIARNFGKMMEQGKVKSALRYLSRNSTGGVLSLDDMIPSASSGSEPVLRSTRDVLQDKHPTVPIHHLFSLAPLKPTSSIQSSLKT